MCYCIHNIIIYSLFLLYLFLNNIYSKLLNYFAIKTIYLALEILIGIVFIYILSLTFRIY